MVTSYFTKEGLDRLKAELHELKTQGRAEAAKAIAEARAQGDLSENAEYDAAKEAQGHLERKIAELETALANARVLDDNMIDTSKVSILSKVELLNTKTQKTVLYTLVTESEANLKEGKIAIQSPIGRGLLGKVPGEVATIQTPAGVIEFKVIKISK